MQILWGILKAVIGRKHYFLKYFFLMTFLTSNKQFEVVSQAGVLGRFEGDSIKEKSIFANILVLIHSTPWYCTIVQTKGEYFLHPNCWILLWWIWQARLSFCIDLSKAEHVRFSSQMALLRGFLSDPLSLRLCLNFGSVKYRLIKTLRVIWALSENAALKIIYDTIMYQKADKIFASKIRWNNDCPSKTLVIICLNSENTKKILLSNSWSKREQAVDTKPDLVLLLSISQD